MKKLLSLLSVLTISGTTVPTTIAASPYQKEETIKGKRQTQNPIFRTNGADKPTEQQIKNKIQELNPKLDINNINVTEITENSAVITVTGFSSQKTIHFTVDKSNIMFNLDEFIPSIIFIYKQEKEYIQNQLFNLNYDIENKETEISDAKEYYDQYLKLYRKTNDTGYLEYANTYQKQVRLFTKHLISMKNTKNFYIQRIQYLNQYLRVAMGWKIY